MTFKILSSFAILFFLAACGTHTIEIAGGGNSDSQYHQQSAPIDGHNCGYAFETETDSSAIQNLWQSAGGLWMTSDSAFDDVEGSQPPQYSKNGFEVDLSSGYADVVTFKYAQLSTDGLNYNSRTYARDSAEAKIANYRVGKILSSGKYEGFRFIEAYNADEGDCVTRLIRVDGDQLQIVGTSLSSGEQSDPNAFLNEDAIGLSIFKKIQ